MIKKFIRTKFHEAWKKYKIVTSNGEIEGITKNDKKVFIFLAADYPNFGDIAITYAQKKFLEECYPEYTVIEVPANKTFQVIKNIKKILREDDVITTVGGGNMGNIYEYYEDLRRTVIKEFKNNYIISFPQTIDFSDDELGKKSLMKTIKTVKKAKNILIFAREEKSYKKMVEYFGEDKVRIFPDIVLSLKGKINLNKEKENKVGICFRNDKEEDKTKKQYIDDIMLQTSKEDRIFFDTVLDREEFNYENRYEQLFEIFAKINSCKEIYTNRLHAMIFAYLTDTKCFFIDNTNKKISETYKRWLNNVENIEEYGIKFNKESKDKIDLDFEFANMKNEILRSEKNG